MIERDPRLYIDCTSTFRSGLNTGVQRVVRSLIAQTDTFSDITQLECIPVSYQFNGFYTLDDAKDITLDNLNDFTPLDFLFRDVYLCPDAFWSAGMTSWYNYFRDQGVSIATVIYDLIPIMHPEFCDPKAAQEFESALVDVIKKSDLLFTISESTRQDLLTYCASIGETLDDDRCPVIPLAPALQSEKQLIDTRRIPTEPFFLMVGTVEPRRGYVEAVAEYQAYLTAGGQASLLIIGKEGGAAGAISESLRRAGTKVKWLSDASDAELMAAYQQAMAVVCPSHSEGYGMSVSEGIAYNGLVLANRLPVFGEFAGAWPYYFDINRKGDLARLLEDTPNLTRLVKAPGMGSWRDTARAIALNLVDISQAHGRHQAVELLRNSEEAVRWAYWLLFGRVCSPAEVAGWLKFETVQAMFDGLQYESRSSNALLSNNSVRWLQQAINGRQAIGDEEVAYWCRQCESVGDMRCKLLSEHCRLDAPASELFVRWGLSAILKLEKPEHSDIEGWLEQGGTNEDFLKKIIEIQKNSENS
ncbi:MULTISPECIES: glycosyltransferase [Lonsdalea]|uniref:Uncharacterized protein n=2 Tax=Lonsdalea TaxID=1082702 RepID=A0ACD1JBK0_9GAMM|nr:MULTISPECIES: glycosyltransferase [Lonsdalea]RAT13175.1 hypothetical protein AU485_09645 [Lonsdalea quercina]RAT19969.1 hypothetical protein AU487_09480 [Lonsdalea populi]RAT20300.1 hypothetical protein AU488_14410 [Lonsdalea populi]RAT25033.1 hypothetical protein AU489_07780 [Lonsdalea populi]RAT33571.1 hypothetical protein AU492_10300 [Lonsdalea populi]